MILVALFVSLFQVGILSAERSTPACLSYEPATVTLKGTIERTTFPGPPNYESIKDGDAPETYWVLHLAEPVCVDAKTNSPDPYDPDNEPERNVARMQMGLTEQQYADYSHLVGTQVLVTGHLAHAFTGHHHTPIRLIDISEINPLATN
jgi:hypothetical protein